ncbi:uncharacterized protein LOC131681172 [Topomyia yanbarensis]|uniref:uncharacterized protein LOC131681172 n=1 Tax=Topomyia yanbarensis TaxID=2498891 RepID=UPI00273B4C12|nr:uncharacterized protein LOC131681172 [Topomyia yanbarensis]
MTTTATLIEWMELLNDMLQFLDATATSAQHLAGLGKAINGNQQQLQHHHHPQCGDDFKCEEEHCDWRLQCENRLPPETTEYGQRETAEYMNIVNKIDESRYMLIHKCKSFLGMLEKRLPRKQLATGDYGGKGEEDENSYLEMGGVGNKNGTNFVLPTDRIDASCENSVESGIEGDVVFEEDDISASVIVDGGKNEEELSIEENCYDFTTDSCLYDDCSELKLSNLVSLVSVEDDISKCPFSGLPATHLRLKQSPKYGTLFRLEKRLFFDQSKKFYVGLLDKWLLLYNNCNELKPAQCVQVKDIKLDLSLNDQINEKNQFNIITQNDGKLCFLTPSFKELNEWVVAIQQNLLAKGENASGNSPRKLPLPPTPDIAADEPDNGTDSKDHEDGIYEEPQQLLCKQHPTTKDQHNYDTPKAATEVGHNLSQQNTKVSPSKIINVVPISPGRPNKCEPICQSPVPTVASISSSQSTSAATTTPVKSWLFNRFNKSPDSGAGVDQKHVRKPPHKKHSFHHQQDAAGLVGMKPTPAIGCTDGIAKPPISIKSPSVTVPSASHKGSKINMIISQLEANGQLSLLSKSWNEQGKRNTWCAEE